MKRAKLFVIFLLGSVLVISQVAMASAAPSLDKPSPITGTVMAITLETEPSTAITTVLVSMANGDGVSQTIRLGQETAVEMGLILLDEDGNPKFNEKALGWEIEIRSKDVIADEEDVLHPVASALATFFAAIPGLDYDVIMSAHEAGNGFGVIAQALWLTQKLEGDSTVLLDILEAKKTGDFSAFTLPDGTIPANWGQFRKAVLDGDKKGNLGVVMSNKEKDKDKDQDQGNAGKSETSTNGDQGNAGNHGNKDKDKDNNGKKDKPK